MSDVQYFDVILIRPAFTAFNDTLDTYNNKENNE